MQTNPLVILQLNGPLPVSAQFTAPSASVAMMMVSGTVWTGSGGTWNGVNISLDGAQVGTAKIYLNQASVHTAFPSTIVMADLTHATPTTTCTITLSAATTTTTTDLNDVYQVALFY